MNIVNFSTKNCKQIVNNISPVIHTIFTFYSLTFGLGYDIIITESEGNIMAFGIKITEYHLLNDEVGQQVKKKLIEKYDTISIEEDEKLIIIKIGTTFDTNDILWN